MLGLSKLFLFNQGILLKINLFLYPWLFMKTVVLDSSFVDDSRFTELYSHILFMGALKHNDTDVSIVGIG